MSGTRCIPLVLWAGLLAPVRSVVADAPAATPATGADDGRTEVTLPMDSLVVLAERERLPFHEPGAVTVLEADQLQRESPATMPDLLRDQPGVFVQQTSPGQGAPIVRGLIGSAVLVLVDGVRLNGAFFRPAPNQFFALVDAYNIGSLEIVRGAGASLLGSDAMGGAIRIFTANPEMKGPELQARARARSTFSSAARSWMSRLSLEAGKQGVGLTGGVTHQSIGDLRGGGDVGRQRPSGYSAYAADGKLVLERGAQQATLGLQYLRQPSTPRYDELQPGFGRAEPAADLFLFDPLSRLLAHGRYRLTAGAAALRTLDLRLSYQRIRDDRRVRGFGATVEQRERSLGQALGANVEAVTQLGAGLAVTYGAELYRDLTSSSRQDHDLATGTVSEGTARYPDGAVMWSAGLFAQGSWRLHPRVLLTPGIRFNLFATDIPAADRPVGAELTLAALSGGLGLLVETAPGLNLVLNGGRGFRAPNVFDLSSLGDRPGNRYQVPNLALRPESIVTVDGGLKLQRPKVAGELFGFGSVYRDKIEAVPTGGTSDSGRQLVQSRNVNRVLLLGVESGLRLTLTPAWQLSGAVNYTRGDERLADGQRTPADRIPPFSGRGGVSWRRADSFLVEGFVRWATAQRRLSDRDRSDPRIDPRGTPGWTTVNLRIDSELHRQMRLRLALENLLDQRYREHGSGIEAAGFSAVAGLEVRL